MGIERCQTGRNPSIKPFACAIRKIIPILGLAILFCGVFAVNASAQATTDNQDVMYLLGCRASEIAMKELNFTKGDSSILVMTTASFAIIDGHPTGRSIDGIADTTGCTVGKGNLLLIHMDKDKPLWLAFFNNRTKECVYLQVNNAVVGKSVDQLKALPDSEVFTKIAKENVGADKLLNEPDVWDKKTKAKVFGGNEFSIITIANVWAKGAPEELIRASQFHNHICPGLTSGYFILKYLDRYLPLEKPSQEYQIIAIQPWCKDDCLQWNLDATIGHKSYTAEFLTEEQLKKLPANATNVANIVIRWDPTTGTGKGIVVKFDWDKMYKMCGINKNESKLKMDLCMADYYDKPEMFVSTIKEFDVNSPAELIKLKSAGVNPLVELGIMSEQGTTSAPVSTLPEKTPSIPGFAVIAAIVIASVVVCATRRRKI